MGQKCPRAEGTDLCNSDGDPEDSRNSWIKMLHGHRAEGGGSGVASACLGGMCSELQEGS